MPNTTKVVLWALWDAFDNEVRSLTQLANTTVSGSERDRLRAKASGVKLCRARVEDEINDINLMKGVGD